LDQDPDIQPVHSTDEQPESQNPDTLNDVEASVNDPVSGPEDSLEQEVDVIVEEDDTPEEPKKIDLPEFVSTLEEPTEVKLLEYKEESPMEQDPDADVSKIPTPSEPEVAHPLPHEKQVGSVIPIETVPSNFATGTVDAPKSIETAVMEYIKEGIVKGKALECIIPLQEQKFQCDSGVCVIADHSGPVASSCSFVRPPVNFDQAIQYLQSMPNFPSREVILQSIQTKDPNQIAQSISQLVDQVTSGSPSSREYLLKYVKDEYRLDQIFRKIGTMYVKPIKATQPLVRTR
jgi:hypothetical protein